VAQAAPVLTAQPFVVEVSRAASQEVFEAQLAKYVDTIRDAKWSNHIREWTREEMTMDAVYTVRALPSKTQLFGRRASDTRYFLSYALTLAPPFRDFASEWAYVLMGRRSMTRGLEMYARRILEP
jgi:hypothetical protein